MRVRLEVDDDGVAAVTLTRPDKHNALEPRTFEELEAAAAELHARPGARAVVISGEGPSFCSGLDFGAVRAAGAEGRARLVERDAGGAMNLVQRCALAWQELPIPVIAALHGHVLGGGLQIALGADIRIAAPSTRLAILELVHGLVPDMGLSVTLPALVRLDVAKQLAWTGRAIDAHEALRFGLVTAIADDPGAAALELARDIAERSLDAVREAKVLLNRAWARHDADRLLRDEGAAQERLRGIIEQKLEKLDMLRPMSQGVAVKTRDAIGNVLRERAQERPGRICCALDDHAFTFAEMDARSDTIAAGAAALGVAKGDRVATLAPNRVELLELFYGLAKSGAAQVPLNAFLKGEFLRHQLAQSRASVVITDAAGREALAPLRAELPDLKTVVMLDDPEGDELPYAALTDAGDTPPDVTLTAADTMSIVYTSGTTGLPKGCVASHGYYCRSGDVIGSALELTDDDVLFAGLPLFHSGGRLVTVAMPLLFGIPAHIQGTFSATNYFPRAREVGCTVMIAVGAMGAAVLATEPSEADRDHSVTRVMCAPLTGPMQQVFRDRFGVDPWVDVFGQSECMPIAATPLSSERRDPAGCGLAAHDLEVALLDDDGHPVEGEGVGEICVRPNAPHAMFDGYFERPEATLEAFKRLWYHTGDYGKRLPSGALAFVDRKKDALRRRGENVSSIELEMGINGHPQIVESAVHATPSELGEDDIKACVVVAEGEQLDPAELFGYFKDHLPYFAIPRYVEPVAALPRNAVGRVMKHKLREAGNGPDTLDFDALGLTVAKDERR